MGGGFYSGFTQLRVSEAWEFFGAANGVTGLGQMRAGRALPPGGHPPGDDPVIGCLFIRDVEFFPGD